MSTTATSAAGRRTHRPLAFYLGLFGLVILLPALIFGGFLIWQFTSISREASERRAYETVESLVQDVDGGIQEMVTSLRILANSPELTERDLNGFHKRVRSALGTTHLHVILVDRDMQQLLNTRVDFGASLGAVSDLESVRRAIETKQTVVSNLFYGKVAGKHVFNVVMPIVQDGNVRFALIMTRDADTMVDLLSKQRLPEGWTATILDRSGVVVARSLDNADFAAKPSRLSDLASAREGRVRTVVQTDDRGTPTLHAVGRSGLSSWILIASVPISVIEAPLYASWTLFAVVGGILLGFSLLFVALIAGRMGATMGALAREAGKLGRGEAVGERRYAIRETNDVSEALHNAYRELRTRSVALRESEEHLRLTTEAAELGTWERNLETGEITTSSTYRRMLGLGEDEIFAAMEELRRNVHPDDRARIRDSIENLLSTGQQYDVEYRVELPDGEERWILSRGRLSVDEESGRRRLLGVVLDITERKQREARVAFLMREMSHRAKNLLSVIQAMAGQTARSSANLGEFQERFADRLQSLARSNDLLVRENWQGAPVENLIRSQLSAFLDVDGGQVEIHGDPLSLAAPATQTLGLALHELATNAAKYGALSVPEGRVAISWRVEHREAGRRFCFTWTETGGPTVSPPARRGFGTAVIERLTAQSLHADIKLDYAAEGVRWTLEAPLAEITPSVPITAASR